MKKIVSLIGTILVVSVLLVVIVSKGVKVEKVNTTTAVPTTTAELKVNEKKTDKVKKPKKKIKPDMEKALFVGDSRTVGLMEYGNIEGSDYFCGTGMSVYNIRDEKESVRGIGKLSLFELLSKKQYSYIYVMLGINELGYNLDQNTEKFKALIGDIIKEQPKAKIIIQGNLHVTAKRSDTDKIYNNNNINYYNEQLSKLSDGKQIFYIDANVIFDDESGNMDENKSSDSTHPLGKYYDGWSKWIIEQTTTIINS